MTTLTTCAINSILLYVALSEEKIKNELLYNSLTSLGNIFALDIRFDYLDHEILDCYPENWKRYNPRKYIPRFGLSLTSLDGGMTGVPDLDSLLEYNVLNNTKYSEDSFKIPTEAFYKLNSISDPLKDFVPHLGRSHLIRLKEGGYFPYHRDSQNFGSNCFRLISCLIGCGPSDLCFIYDQQKILLEPNRLYFMNTKVEHALFSTNDKTTLLVLNVILSEGSTQAVLNHLLSK